MAVLSSGKTSCFSTYRGELSLPPLRTCSKAVRRKVIATDMLEFCKDLLATFQPPPHDPAPPVNQAHSYREVVSLQAIFVTLTIALLAYIQKDPVFHLRVDALFAIMASVPMAGLFHIVRGRVRTPQCDVYVCTQPIRAYARQAFILDLLIVLAVSCLYWRGQLPGQ
jgi:hypothetical protein